MRYQVPQFIGVEDKIFGSLSAKQFLYVGGAAAMGFIIWNIFPPMIAIILGAPIVILFLMFAFFKFDGWQPFVQTFENSIKYFSSSKRYIWKKVPKKLGDQQKNLETPEEDLFMPKLSDSKLKDLSWSLDINESLDRFNN